MSYTLTPATDPLQFDQAVAGFRYSSPLQSWGYGEARRTLGEEPLRFYLEQDGTRVGAVQVLRRRLLPGVTRLYAARGPAFDDPAVLPGLAGAIRSIKKRTDAFMLIEPPLQIPADDEHAIPARFGPWLRSERTEQPEHTLICDLSQDQEAVFAGLHKMARRNVRTAERMGVEVARDEDFEDFWHLFAETNARAQIAAFPRRYYETLFREGRRYGGDAYLLLSRHEGKALAGGFFLALGPHTCYLFGGSVRDDRPPAEGLDKRKDVKAPDAFYWHSIVDAQQAGYEVLDLWGIPRELREDKHSFGVFKMKLKFSEQRAWFPGYRIDLSPVAKPLALGMRGWRKWTNYRTRGTTDDIL